MKETIEVKTGDYNIKIETNRWAKQSNGAAVVSYADNIVFATANMREEAKDDQDFFPLMVDFRENNFAVGKIPGGFFKREGRLSEREILLSRMIDRPIRPLFPEYFYNDTQVIASILSGDFSVDYDSLGIIAASAALLSSTIPFTIPVAAVKIGHAEGSFLINPGRDKEDQLDMMILAAGTQQDIVMLEAEGREFSEDLFKQGIKMAKNLIREICLAQQELINPDKLEVVPDDEYLNILKDLRTRYSDRIRDAIFSPERVERRDKIKALEEEVATDIEDEVLLKKHKNALHKLEYEIFRQTLIAQKKRTDGRENDEIRPITIEKGILPRVHGSAVFTRGETQAMATVTLGSEDDAKRLDEFSSMNNDYKKFMLHYNFPPYSVGEVAFLRGAGRREIGHGNLAEKALSYVIPENEEFPYTIRVVSDILESNGSSSMATVCGGTLSLMDAGVPIKEPVAGIAMGLVKEGEDYMVLTDIAGYEDHFGDMDFKIAGTRKGITAMQLDIKIDGLSDDIIDATLDGARKAREFILDRMGEVIPEPAKSLSQYAPVILTMNINTEKIKDLIGPGGKTIKELVSTYDVKIHTEDDGKVSITAPNHEVGQQVVAKVKELTDVVEIGKVYRGKITRIESFGVFVELSKGNTGLVHISEIAHHRVNNLNNYRLGQMMEVKVIGFDKGKIKLSKKALERRHKQY